MNWWNQTEESVPDDVLNQPEHTARIRNAVDVADAASVSEAFQNQTEKLRESGVNTVIRERRHKSQPWRAWEIGDSVVNLEVSDDGFLVETWRAGKKIGSQKFAEAARARDCLAGKLNEIGTRAAHGH